LGDITRRMTTSLRRMRGPGGGGGAGAAAAAGMARRRRTQSSSACSHPQPPRLASGMARHVHLSCRTARRRDRVASHTHVGLMAAYDGEHTFLSSSPLPAPLLSIPASSSLSRTPASRPTSGVHVHAMPRTPRSPPPADAVPAIPPAPVPVPVPVRWACELGVHRGAAPPAVTPLNHPPRPATTVSQACTPSPCSLPLHTSPPTPLFRSSQYPGYPRYSRRRWLTHSLTHASPLTHHTTVAPPFSTGACKNSPRHWAGT